MRYIQATAHRWRADGEEKEEEKHWDPAGGDIPPTQGGEMNPHAVGPWDLKQLQDTVFGGVLLQKLKGSKSDPNSGVVRLNQL